MKESIKANLIIFFIIAIVAFSISTTFANLTIKEDPDSYKLISIENNSFKPNHIDEVPTIIEEPEYPTNTTNTTNVTNVTNTTNAIDIPDLINGDSNNTENDYNYTNYTSNYTNNSYSYPTDE